MARVCGELRVVRNTPEESATGYISWLNGACAQLDGIGRRIDEALKQEVCSFSEDSGGDRPPCEVDDAVSREGSDKALSVLGIPSRRSLRFLGGLVETA
uniref:Uncharacterized protein n=1 Tax=Oryza sativa subsp. japonica TaxID=39947 RepID=Q655S8_ORYSJ|nr:hypothetical protein [Oryza sativa Japonica Group]BAD45439.1 hypothetical protein [Oryza sativa Japonica Group]